MPSTTEPAAESAETAGSPGSAGRPELELVNESRELKRVITRLQARYPTLSADQIRTAVSVAVHAFDGAKVRHFVPLLVERIARQSLDHVRDQHMV